MNKQKNIKKGVCLILTSFFISLSFSQNISNVTSAQEGDKIRIYYLVSGMQKDEQMNINLYYALENGNYSGPLQNVSGDVGSCVISNGRRSILWDVIAEQGGIEGNIKFKVEAIKNSTQGQERMKGVGKDMTAYIESCVLEGTILNVTFTLISAIDENWKFSNDKVILFDEFGTKLESNSFKWANNSDDYATIYLMKDVPFKITFIFNNVNPQIKMLNALEISNAFSTFKIPFRNVPVLKK